MKKLFSFLITILIIQMTQAQDSWTIKLNGKILLSTSKEDTLANAKKIKAIEWRKNGFLEVSYKEADPNSIWNYSFLFYDEKDNQLLVKDSVTHTKVSVATLRKLFAGKKKIVIYAMQSPKNPMIAVRVRRIYLCTLLLP